MDKVKEKFLIESPLFQGESAQCVDAIPVSYLIKGYKNYGIDVTRYFVGMDEVYIYECTKSGYRFYHPPNSAGDSEFYELLQEFEWYYMPWKWEHEAATDFLADGMAILEIGSAHGAFLSAVSDRFQLSKVIGLELNESVQKTKGELEILNMSIQDYAKSNAEMFDVVCSYQVLEHITNIRPFLESAVRCLKPRGKLIISVPNNSGFLSASRSVLNMPPHHMGLWNADSLKHISNIFQLKLIDTIFEPLQDYHIDACINAKYYKSALSLSSKIKRRMDRFTGKYKKYYDAVRANRDNLMGHTVMVVFEKI